MNKTTVTDSIMKAAHNYCTKIDWVMDNKPDDTGELACLYAGIGGITECIKTLSDDGLISRSEEDTLNKEMDELFAHCRVRTTD